MMDMVSRSLSFDLILIVFPLPEYMFSMLFFLILIIIVSAWIAFVRMFLYVITIEGSSMSPTLKEGDQVLVLRHLPIRFLRRSQIVVLDLSKAASIPAPKPTVVIKRLTGLPGDSVRLPISQVDENVIFADLSTLREDGYYEFQIPTAHCFVMADGHGSDSRHWGPIPLHAMVGVVIKRMSLSAVKKDENELA